MNQASDNTAEKTVDRRVRKTKKLLRQGLMHLMQEKSIKDISVKELADLVDINRGTFYIHYKDVFDMVEQIENEMFDGFNAALNKNYDEAIASTDPLPIFVNAYTYLAEYSDLCMVLLGKNGDIAFLNKLKDAVRERCLRPWETIFRNKDIIDFEYFYSFILSGSIGILSTWLENGQKESPEQIASMTCRMIINGLKFQSS